MRIRITFAKQGALRYTGHLDLHKLWERAARRAGLPLAYSQGFHPQPKIQLAAALPLGFSSRCEIVDLWLGENYPVQIAEIQAALPQGIQILRLEQVDERAPALQTLVTSAEYEVTLLNPPAGSDLNQRLAAVMEAISLPRQRRGKTYDLRPLIESIVFLPANDKQEACLHMRLAARQSATGRPEEVLDALGLPLEETRIERTRLLFAENGLK
jgi:radical SAM-linked protein